MRHQDGDGEQPVRLAAAGGVILRRKEPGGGPQVVVCGRETGSLLALPKGTPNPGETMEETARREVQEETGLEVVPGPLVGKIEYSFTRGQDGAPCEKVVHFFLMTATGGDIALHDVEFDTVEWMDVGEAINGLTYENHARILEIAVAMAAEQVPGGG